MLNDENIGYSHGAQGIRPTRPDNKEYMIGYKKGLESTNNESAVSKKV